VAAPSSATVASTTTTSSVDAATASALNKTRVPPGEIALIGFRFRYSSVFIAVIATILVSYALYLNVTHVRMASEIAKWQSDYEKLESRVLFLHSLSLRMAAFRLQVRSASLSLWARLALVVLTAIGAKNQTAGAELLASEWSQWRHIRSIEWKLLQWKERFELLSTRSLEALRIGAEHLRSVGEKALGISPSLRLVSQRHATLAAELETTKLSEQASRQNSSSDTGSWLGWIGWLVSRLAVAVVCGAGVYHLGSRFILGPSS